jgi:hypothetical protein
MPSVSLSPAPKLQFFGTDGNPLVGGKVYTYAAGTSTSLTTYYDSTGTAANTNPIILDTRGEANIWLTSAAYKFVLKTSTDTLIWTVDNITSNAYLISLLDAFKADLANTTDVAKGDALVGFKQSNSSGILAGAVGRTVHEKFQEMISVKDFGATGDGITNDTTAMQNALTAAAGKSLYIPAGTYVCNQLVVSSGTSVYGDSASTTIIQATSSLGSSTPLFRNLNQIGTPNVYSDSGISIKNIGFNGNNLGSRSTGLVDFGKVQDLTIDNCQIYNIQYIGISLSGCLYANVLNCVFKTCGNQTVTAEGGAALWIGNAGVDGTPSFDVKVTNNSFNNNNWSAIYATANRILIANNYLDTNKESGIFMTGSVCVIANNWISNQTRKNISASGIEIGGDQITISGNFIGNTEDSNISLTDVNFVTITGNSLLNPRMDGAYYAQASCIGFATLTASPNNNRYVTIVGNNMWSPTNIAYAAVSFYGTTSPPEFITISDNQMNQNSWVSGQAINVPANQASITQIFRDNPGAFDVFDYGGYVSGRFYAGEALSPAAASTLAISANTLYGTPFVVRQQKLWNKIGLYVTTAALGGAAYLGIYRMENGVPTTKVLDAGAVGLDTVGTKEITISQVLPAGMYCVVLLASTSSAVVKAGTLSPAAVATVGTSAIGTADTVILGSATYGALPGTFPAVTYGTGDSALITLRC